MKGQKQCPKCKAVTGPRAHFCSSCGNGFVVKGVKQEDRVIVGGKVEPPKQSSEPAEFVLPPDIQPVEDLDYRKKYQAAGHSWTSTDGLYLIREINTFMGVNMKEHYGHPFCLMFKNHGRFELTPKSHFKTLGGTIRYMERHRATSKSRN